MTEPHCTKIGALPVYNRSTFYEHPVESDVLFRRFFESTENRIEKMLKNFNFLANNEILGEAFTSTEIWRHNNQQNDTWHYDTLYNDPNKQIFLNDVYVYESHLSS